MKKLPLLESSATLIGTVIGAGVLGIPYAMAQVGFWPGLGLLVILAGFMLLRHLMLAEITLRTPQVHQTPGYSGIYLGAWARRLDFVITLLGRYGSLLAYIIGVGLTLQALLGGTALFWSASFFLLGIIFIYKGLNLIKQSELILSSFILLITLLIGVFSWQNLQLQNLNYWNFDKLVLPYGVFLFAFAGGTAIPLMREELKNQEKLLLKSIFYGSIFILAVYVIFAFFVLGVTGGQTTEIATVGLGEKIGPQMILIGNLLAFFTMATSFLTIGLGTLDTYTFDFNLSSQRAWLLTILVPIVLYFLGARDFIMILGLTGGLLTSLQTIILVMTFWQARHKGLRQPEFTLGPMRLTGIILILIFGLGAGLTLFKI